MSVFIFVDGVDGDDWAMIDSLFISMNVLSFVPNDYHILGKRKLGWIVFLYLYIFHNYFTELQYNLFMAYFLGLFLSFFGLTVSRS